MRGTKARALRKVAHTQYPTLSKTGYDRRGTFYGQNWRRFYRMLKRGAVSVIVTEEN
jgi:hypothetical protein